MASLASRAESSEQFCMSGDFTAAASSLGTSSAACRNDATEMKVNELVVSGKALFRSNDHDAARLKYQEAKDLSENVLQPMEGLAEIEASEGNFSQAIEIYTELHQLAVGTDEGRQLQPAKAREYLWRLAECYARNEDYPPAEKRLNELLGMPLAGLDQRLEALCFLADIQIKVEDAIQQKELQAKLEDDGTQPGKLKRSPSMLALDVAAARADAQDGEGGLADTLNTIVGLASPSPRYLKYFDRHLQRQLSLMTAYPPRSQARQEKRLIALRTCKTMIETRAGGCCTPFPFEAAIWLWEETEELYGGHLPSAIRQPTPSFSGSHTGGTVPGNLGASIRQLSCSSIDGGLGSRSSSRGGSPIASPRTSMASGLMSTSPHPRRSMDFMSTDPRAMRPSHGGSSRNSLPGSPRQSSSRRSTSGRSPQSSPASPMMQAVEASHKLRAPMSPPKWSGSASQPSSRRGSWDKFNSEAAHPTTDLSIPYTSRVSIDASGNSLMHRSSKAGVQSLDIDRGTAQQQSSAFMTMMQGPAEESPFGRPPPPEVVSSAGPPSTAAAVAVLPPFRDTDHTALPPLCTSRHSSCGFMGGDGLPLDVADSIRNVCANANYGNDLVTSKVEACGLTMAHMFPWAPASAVAVGLAMRRRLMSDPAAPSTRPKRQRILRYLRRGVTRGVDSAAGWMGLAELQYQERRYQSSYDTGVQGLAWAVRRQQQGYEALTQFTFSMRLVVAKSLRRLHRLDDAEYAFKVLAGWVTEGEGAFSEMSGSHPRNIHQEALRGIAKVLLERGDRDKAKAQYEKILGKALLGRGRAEHWAHSEYAWIAFEDGDLQPAKEHLEMAVEEASQQGSAVTDWELAEHHYRLGRVLWAIGGLDRHQAKLHFQIGAAEDDHVQASSLAWLGVWHAEQASDPATARSMFQAALALDPEEPTACEGLGLIMANEMDRVGSLADWSVQPVPK